MTQQQTLTGSYEDLYEKAASHMQMGEYDEAEAIFERMYKRLSKLSEKTLARQSDLLSLRAVVMESLATLLKRRDELERALPLYQKLLEMLPNFEGKLRWQNAIAQIKIDQGQVDEGMDELRGLAMMYPGEVMPWLSLGLASLEQEDYEAAETNLIRAMEREAEADEDEYRAHFTLFSVYKTREAYDKATEVWQKIVKITDINDYYPIYTMYLEANKLKETEKWLEREENPLMLGLYQGLVARAKGDENAAKHIWQKMVAKSPLQYKRGYEAWAEAALYIGHKPEEIVSVLHEILRHGRITPQRIFMLALAQIRANNINEAHEDFKELINNEWPGYYEDGKYLLWEHDWTLFKELIEDEAIREDFKQYFKREA